MLKLEKISHKQFKKKLITAKLQNKILKSKNIVLYNTVLHSKEDASALDLNKFSKNFIQAFTSIIFKFPAKVKIYEDNSFLKDFTNFSSIAIKNNNLLLKNVVNNKIISNSSYAHVYKSFSSLTNSFFYFSKFI